MEDHLSEIEAPSNKEVRHGNKVHNRVAIIFLIVAILHSVWTEVSEITAVAYLLNWGAFTFFYFIYICYFYYFIVTIKRVPVSLIY